MTCRGRVMQKVFTCHHPRHERTIIAQCKTCADYQPETGHHTVERWALGVVSAPRERATLARTLRSLRAAGWSERVHVFAEDGVRLWWGFSGLGPLSLVRRAAPALGAWPNFLLALSELVLRDPEADAYLMIQDDVAFAKGLRSYLEEQMWPGPFPGVVSLHTARHLAAKSGTGFFEADLGWSTWGAQAFVFPNASARALLSDAKVAAHRLNGPLNGLKNVDSVVGEWCRRTKREFWLHAPSLCEHIGETSTLWPGTTLEGRRVSADFPGEAQDVGEVVRARAAGAPAAVVMLEDGSLAERARGSGKPVDGIAGEIPAEFEEFWNSMTLDIVSISMGREGAFAQWSEWLRSAVIPPVTSLVLVDNTRQCDTRARARLHDLVRELLEPPHRFRSVTTVRGEGPSDQSRSSDDRVRNCSLHYELGFARVAARFCFVLDDDVIPPADGLRHLAAAWQTFALQGRQPGLVSGCYESARSSGILVAGRNFNTWSDQPKLGEPAPGVVESVGFAGLGCAFLYVPALRKPGRFDFQEIHGGAGPDDWLCRELRRLGHTIWLHGSVVCEHLHQEGADDHAMD